MDPWRGPAEGFRPFNYSVRKIQAALTVVPDVEVEVLDVYSEDLDALEAEIERRDPDLVGASVYVWSLPSFYELARRLKRNRPDRLIVFGGPSARPAMLWQPPFRDAVGFVDALVLGEGEEIIRDIVTLVASGASRERLREIVGVATVVDGRWATTGERSRVANLDALPSPYQLGLVPRHVTAHLESFRGCPFSCTFCEWGILGSASPVFSTEYLTRELEAMRNAGAIGAFSIDAALNLNARAFRNLKAAIERTALFREIE
ncbi:MAG TPA: cobalamin-dependent protein, partial [Polyangia bacterium]